MREIVGFISFVFFILFSLFLVWFGLRSYGLSQPVNTYQTPLVQELSQEKQQTWEEASENYLWAYARFSETKKWLVDTPESEVALSEFFNKHPNKKVLLFIEIENSRALPSIRETMKVQQNWKRTIFCSRNDGPLKDLRELEPRWSYCSGEVFLTRILAFASLGLESLLNISSDAVFIHLDKINATSTFKTVIAEAKRQNKLVIMGPVARPLEGFQPHGWMIKN